MLLSKLVQAELLDTYNVHNTIALDVINIDTSKNNKLNIHLIILDIPEISRFCQFICYGLLNWVDLIKRGNLYKNSCDFGGRGWQQKSLFIEYDRLSNSEYLREKFIKSSRALILSKWIIAS